MNRKVRLQLQDLHPHVTCQLCNGYLVDATTIVECLHSFCRTCIVHYLYDHKCCPVCNVQIHKTRPLLNIRHDQTLQDIVYALVPGIHKKEMKRRKEFWGLRDDKAYWKYLPPEELGDVDQSLWRRTEKKICLSIQPTKVCRNKLSTDSEWMEIDKPITKRYIRCSEDVTIKHLEKFVRMKLNEDEKIQILLFVGENVLPEDYTLSDVIQYFPCKFNETLELTYGVYGDKNIKRKALEDHNMNLGAPLQKKRRLPSATPQLQAFFNSHVPEPPPVEKPGPQVRSLDEPTYSAGFEPVSSCSESVNNTTRHHSTDSSLLSVESVSSVNISSVMSPSVSNTMGDILPPQPPVVTPVAEETEAKSKQEVVVEKKMDENVKKKEDKASNNQSNLTTSQAQPPKKSSENVQFYQMLNIPVDEAVRSKPPTPIEIPPANYFSAKPKRNVEPKKPFVQLHSSRDSSDGKPLKNRRKPIMPHHNVHIAPNPSQIVNPEPISFNIGELQQPGRAKSSPQSAASGRFILLSPPSDPKIKTPATLPERTIANRATSRPYSDASNDQINERALQTVRNILIPTNKRPILPKTSGTQSMIASERTRPVSSARNMFPAEKPSHSMAPLSKPPPHLIPQPMATAVISSSSLSQNTIHSSEILPKQRGAVSQTNLVPSSHSRPPPPYTAPNIISYPASSSRSIARPRPSNPPGFDLNVNRSNSNRPMAQSRPNPVMPMASQRQQLLLRHQAQPRFNQANKAVRPMFTNEGAVQHAPNTIALLRSYKANRLKSNRSPSFFSRASNPRPIAPHPGPTRTSEAPHLRPSSSPTVPPSGPSKTSTAPYRHGPSNTSIRLYHGPGPSPTAPSYHNPSNTSTSRYHMPSSSSAEPYRGPSNTFAAPFSGPSKTSVNASSFGPVQTHTARSMLKRKMSLDHHMNRRFGIDSRKVVNYESSDAPFVNRNLKSTNQFTKNQAASFSHSRVSGASGAFVSRPSLARSARPTKPQTASFRDTFREIAPRTTPTSVPRAGGAMKRKLEPIGRRSPPSPPMVPPIGTKSPWSQRGYSLSPVMGHTPEFASSSKLSGYSPPPPAHQHGPPKHRLLLSSNENDEQPLELTSKSSRISHSPQVASPVKSNNEQTTMSQLDPDQPLCLVVKKR